MTSEKILLIGGGGHCKSVLDTILSHNDFSEIGIIEKTKINNSVILGIPVIGCDDELKYLYNNGYKYSFITVGSIGDPKLRIKIFGIIKDIGFEIPNIIDETACVSKFAKLGRGIFIGKHAVVNAGSVIDNCAIINTGALIEHDCTIEEFVHIAPGAVLLGNVTIGRNTHIGANSVIRQQLKIGSDTIVGMGSTVTNSIESKVIAYGNPCKVVKRLEM